VSDLTGVDVRSLKAYAAGTASPNLAKFKRLLAVLGPELGREIDRMYGWTPREGMRLPPGAVDLRQLHAELSATLRVVDGMLTGTDAPSTLVTPTPSRRRR
jgi:hypothetical protein